MKILLIIDHFGSGGAQRQLLLLAKGLSQRGHEVHIFRYYENDHYSSLLSGLNLHVHTVCKKHRFDIQPLLSLRSLIRRHGFDATISFLNTPNFYNEVCSLGLRHKVIVSERTTQVPGAPITLLQRLFRCCHRLSDLVVVNSYTQSDFLRRNFTFLKNKITTVYNGVDTELFRPAEARSNSHPKNRHFRFLIVGRIHELKNPLGIIRSLIKVTASCDKSFSVDWAGSVHDQDLFDSCSALIEKEGAAWFNWLGEIRDVHSLYPSYDALIHPSFYEGFPNVIAEAMSCGLPVLASAVCEHPRIITNNVNGLLFDPNDVADIARSIIEYMSLSRGKKTSIRNESIITAGNFFGLNRYIDEFEGLCRL